MNNLDNNLQLATQAYVLARPESRRAAEAAARALPGGNTRSSLWYDPFPLCIRCGEGSRIVDVDGHVYVDFLGEFTAGIFGHSPAHLGEALAQAFSNGVNLSSHNPLEGRLAEALVGRFPAMDQIRFTNSGTEANLMALTAARAYTHRETILVFEGAYHGSILAFPPGGSPTVAPYPFVVSLYNDLASARRLVWDNENNIAAILVEPMLGAGGCVPGTSDFLHGLRALCDEIGALLIFDEIQTSRLAFGGRQSQLGIAPDLTTLGKFFGGGLAFGAFGGRSEIMGMFDPRNANAISHPGTFNNNTLTMAAGLAGAAHLTTDRLDALNARGEALRRNLDSLVTNSRVPFRVSGLGSLMNIHPTGHPKQAAAWRKLLFLDLLDEGIYIAPRGLIALSLVISEEDVKGMLGAFRRFLMRRADLMR